MGKSALWTEHSAPCQHGYVRSFFVCLRSRERKVPLGALAVWFLDHGGCQVKNQLEKRTKPKQHGFFTLNSSLGSLMKWIAVSCLDLSLIIRVVLSSIKETSELLLKLLWMLIARIYGVFMSNGALPKAITIKPWVNTITWCDNWAWSRTKTGMSDFLHCNFGRALKSLC